jgi:hypothetical protein
MATQDYMSLLGQLAGQDEMDPETQARLRSLRRQQALGVLGQMGGQNVGRFGQALYSGAGQEMKNIKEQQGNQLDRLSKAVAVTKGIKDITADPMAGKAQWEIKADPITGGFIKVNKFTGKVMPVEGYEPGAGQEQMMQYGPNVSKLTEKQVAALNAGRRIIENFPVMENLLQGGYDPGRMDMLWQKYQGNTPAEFVFSQVASDQGKEFYNAGRDILAAILRKESGAAITADEWTQFAPLWLPWPGDSPQQRKNKMARIRTQLLGATVEAGPSGGNWLKWYEQEGPSLGDQYGGQQQTTGIAGDDDIIDLPPPG